MNAQEILATLQRLGKPETAAIYKRHGSGENVFGALTSDIVKLNKKLKPGHALAEELWATGNAEARILALLAFDPAKLTPAAAGRFLHDPQAHFLGCYLTTLVARSPIAQETMRSWMASTAETPREMGYGILSAILKEAPDSITEAAAADILKTIETEIQASPNWARYAMNGALISIGVFKPTLRPQALAAATRIGKVIVDHGETHCKTPEAVSCIQKAAKRRQCP